MLTGTHINYYFVCKRPPRPVMLDSGGQACLPVGRQALASLRSEMRTGTHINYFFVCKRKLWLFSHGVQMEQTSDTVLLGKLIDESSYERKELYKRQR